MSRVPPGYRRPPVPDRWVKCPVCLGKGVERRLYAGEDAPREKVCDECQGVGEIHIGDASRR